MPKRISDKVSEGFEKFWNNTSMSIAPLGGQGFAARWKACEFKAFRAGYRAAERKAGKKGKGHAKN